MRCINCNREIQAPAPASEVPAHLDVRRIMIDVTPGHDGMGEEIYAESVAEVETLLTRMGQQIEDLQGRVVQAPAVTPLTKPVIEQEFMRIGKLLPERIGLIVFDSFIDGVRFAEQKHDITAASQFPVQSKEN